MRITAHTTPLKWLHVTDVFADNDMDTITKYIPKAGLDVNGRRAGNASSRTFVNVNSDQEIKDVFEKFDTLEVRNLFTQLTGVDCGTGRLRVELINDNAGAHLQQHIDIKEKLITFQSYINKGRPNWGTTLYSDWDTEYRTIPFLPNTGWITYAGADVIHGVKHSSVTGERHSVIINYVHGEWNDVDQLYYLK